jgi:hypothetical protein
MFPDTRPLVADKAMKSVIVSKVAMLSEVTS